jgi:integrase
MFNGRRHDPGPPAAARQQHHQTARPDTQPRRSDSQAVNKAFLTRWLTDNVPGTVAQSTEDDYNDTVRLHLIPALGQKRLNRLSVAELDKLWRLKRAAGYSTNSVRIMRTVLRRALGQAEREGIIARNVAALSAPPRVRAKEGRTLTVEQARHLLDAATGHRFELVIILALAYGMRRGEVLGLTWSALDWHTGTLQVTHSVQRIKNREQQPGHRTQLIVGELKTPRSRRSLALTPEILAKLRQHHTRQAEQKMAAGPLWRDHGLIFGSETGSPLDPENFSRAFAKLCTRAGLGHWHPHELRHSGASLMLAQGTPLHVVSEILGHASITITKDVYGHLVEGDRRAVAASMSQALFGPGPVAMAPNMAPNDTKKAPPRSG